MEQTSFPVEYDFKTTKLDLIDKKTGKIKDKYKCLALMITLPLSKPLDQLNEPDEPDPRYKQTTLKSTTNNNDGWLDFIIINNKQPNIITIEGNYLLINKSDYNYDIVVNVIKKGKDDVNLRFMAQNPFSLIAANMNDLNLDETSFSNIYNGQQIKFTIIGGYEFFYINYPTTNFDINITISVSDAKTPTYICDSKCMKCNKCTCFDIKGNGYIKVKDKDVPVYSDKVISNTVNRYLYPEFNYLRDLFYNITLANSLTPPPIPLIEKKIIKPLSDSTTITSLIDVKTTQYFHFLKMVTKLVIVGDNEIKQNNLGNYRYNWHSTGAVIKVSGDAVRSEISYYPPPAISLTICYKWGGAWYNFRNFIQFFKIIKEPTSDDDFFSYTLENGSFDNIFNHDFIKFYINISYFVPARYIWPANNVYITVTQF
jgi:hypothetical protein